LFPRTFLLCFLIFLPFFTEAQEITTEKPLRISLSSFYRNKSVFRGAETWPDPSYFVGPSIILYDRWFIRGPALFYSHFSKNSPFTLSAGISYLSDDEPWPDTSDHEEDYRNQRSSSLELSTTFRYKFGYRNSFYFGFAYYKEVKRHFGQFVEIMAGMPIFPYTSLHLKSGIGDLEANKYIYGPSSAEGEGYRSVSISLVIPHVPWEGIIRAQMERTWVVKDQNRKAEYIKEKYINDGMSLMLVWSII